LSCISIPGIQYSGQTTGRELSTLTNCRLP
jgi:hypothetical protein